MTASRYVHFLCRRADSTSLAWLLLLLGVTGSMMACSGGGTAVSLTTYTVAIHASSQQQQETATVGLTVNQDPEESLATSSYPLT